MLFALIGKYNPQQLTKVHEKENLVFGTPPNGVRVKGRYTIIGGKGGLVNIVEVDNIEALAAISIRAAGIIEFEILPIVETNGGAAIQLISQHLGEVFPMHGPVIVPAEKKEIEVKSVEERKFMPPANLAKDAYIKSFEEYKAIYEKSIKEPEKFWAEVAEQLDWFKKWDKVVEEDFKEAKIKWFLGGKLNVSHNCLDKHLHTWRRNKIALIWEPEKGEPKTYTYQHLHKEVSKFANVLKNMGVKKGDRVTLYLPMIPELPIAMLACTRIGAIHSVVFGGFSAESLRDRIHDSSSKLVVVADGSYRGGKVISLKENSDAALEECPSVEKAVVVRRTEIPVQMKQGRDFWWHELMEKASVQCEAEEMDSEDPLFILYTSGSTGKPKGVLHTTGGYLVYVNQSYKWVFDVKDNDIYWCTADIGWVTGHSYIVYGPLSAGATTIMFEGVPTYPEPDRYWRVVEKYGVTVFYTAPTVIRALMRYGTEWVKKHNLSTLRVLGSVGEPINPEAWMWYYTHVGKERCPVLDTWWQTETGGILISPLPGAIPTKPGSASMPLPGVLPQVIKKDGSPASVNEGGYLVIKRSWPGIMRTVYGEPERFKKTYFSQYPGMYFTGDGARIDEEGFYWLMGRVDDVINVSGHRIGTAEVESALVSHKSVAEAAVVGFPHNIKGQGIYAYVTLKEGVEKSDGLKKELIKHVRKEIGPVATPDIIQFADALPKTRSGKIMRRILRKIAAGETSDLGDTTTLADPKVVDDIVTKAEIIRKTTETAEKK
ncbi:MAG: acetate--CoA ligase [Planctomycetota bacterium]